LADSLPALHASRSRPEVFVAHGRHDGLVSFEGAERCRQILAAHQLPVTWRPFDGDHEIPPEIVEELRGFLFGRQAPPTM
jgi:predicted esterase